MPLQLRPYQQTAISKVESGWKQTPRQLLTSFTGSGKTVMGATICGLEIQRGGTVLWLCNRQELVRQSAEALEMICEQPVGIEMGESHADPAKAVVASVQTLYRRLDDFGPVFSLVVADEAHFLPSKTYADCVRHFVGDEEEISGEKAQAGCKLLGLTATPGREDRKSLGVFFDRVGYAYGIPEGIRDKWVPPIRYKRLAVKIDLEGVRHIGGDYSENEVAARVHPLIGQMVEMLATELKGRRALIFTPLIKQSEFLEEQLSVRGIKIKHVDGCTDGLEQILDGFRDGTGAECLCCSQLLSFGVDLPCCDTIVFLRPVSSRVWYFQALGRGLRTHPGKTELLVLDFMWVTQRHDVLNPFDLTLDREDAEAAANMAEEQDEDQEGGDKGRRSWYEQIADAARLENRQRAFLCQWEAAIAKARNKKLKFPPLLEAGMYATLCGDVDLVVDKAQWGADCKEPTVMQLQTLEKWKIDPSTVRNRWQAQRLLDRVFFMYRNDRPGPKSLYFLARCGVNRPWEMTRSEADGIIRKTKEEWERQKAARQYWSQH